MSKLTRTLIIGATLAAMHLAGMTAVAQAQANDEPVRQPPTERQVGESWRHRQAASPEQTAADAALQRVQARERFSIPNATPAQAPAPVPSNPAGSPAGSSPASVCWLPPWCWRAGWPSWLPRGPGAGLGSGTPPDHDPATRWGCRAHPAAPPPCPRRAGRVLCRRLCIVGCAPIRAGR